MSKNRHLKFASRTIILLLVVSSFAALSANYTIIPILGRHNYDYPQQAFAQSKGKSDTALDRFRNIYGFWAMECFRELGSSGFGWRAEIV